MNTKKHHPGSTTGYVKVEKATWEAADRALRLQPELLAALRALVADCITSTGRSKAAHNDTLNAASAAIAKASK